MRKSAIRCGALWMLLCWPVAVCGRPLDPVITAAEESSNDVAYEVRFAVDPAADRAASF